MLARLAARPASPPTVARPRSRRALRRGRGAAAAHGRALARGRSAPAHAARRSCARCAAGRDRAAAAEARRRGDRRARRAGLAERRRRHGCASSPRGAIDLAASPAYACSRAARTRARVLDALLAGCPRTPPRRRNSHDGRPVPWSVRGRIGTHARRHDELLRPQVDELVAILGVDADTDTARSGVRLRVRGRAPRRPAAQDRRAVHHAPAAASRAICAGLRPSTPAIVAALLHDMVEDTDADARGDRRRVRRRGRAAGRRRHQAVADHFDPPRAGPGRELPQDDRVDGAGRARRADQARRPPAQHAHDSARWPSRSRSRRRARRSRSTRRSPTAWASTRSSGSSRTSPSTTLHPRRYAEIEAMVNQRRADRERFVEEAGAILARAASEVGDQRRDHRPRQALLLDLREDGAGRQGVQRDLRPDRDARAGRLGQGLLRRDRRHPLAVEADARAASRTTSRCPSPTCTSRCTRR